MKYEPVILDGVIPPGTYKVVVAHTEEKTSQVTGKKYLAVTSVIIEGSKRVVGHLLYQMLLYPEDGPKASWVWENAVPHPKEVVPGFVYRVDVKQETWEGVERNRPGLMHRVEWESES